jgi:hypothetical protein
VLGAIVESHTAKIAKIIAATFFLLNMVLVLLRKNSGQDYNITTTLLNMDYGHTLLD